MKKIIEASELPESEKLYLVKGKFGYRVVHPIKNEDGSWNYINLLFGGYQNLFILIAVVIFGAILYLGISELISSYKLIAANPCDFCSICR